MAGWLLLILVHTSAYGFGIQQAGPFADRAACEIAAQHVRQAPSVADQRISQARMDAGCYPQATGR